MNQYHLYSPVGKAKHSVRSFFFNRSHSARRQADCPESLRSQFLEQVVYKARKKKSIDYFAIKSVEKSQRERALQEVEVLSSLSHPGIVQFVSFYETSRHVWLILEYCVGGNLQELLQQVGYLD